MVVEALLLLAIGLAIVGVVLLLFAGALTLVIMAVEWWLGRKRREN